MSAQALLPIFPACPPVGRPDPDAESVRRRAGVEYFGIPIREILNRCTAERMPFTWTVNPYRGCEFGCTYCYARYTHDFFDLAKWEDFERKIFFKEGAADSLLKKLRKAALQGQPIAIGTATDPYQPAERHHRVTRSLLEIFTRVEGLHLSITTKSPLVLRDLDLLSELDARHSITVHCTITTIDPQLARQMEPYAPDPRARLRTVRRLAAAGIQTDVFCMPILPGLNDREEQLRPLLEAARDAGASDVHGGALYLKPAARARFIPWIEQEFPQLAARYRRLFGRRDYLGDAERRDLLATFRRLKLEVGFPNAIPGRG